MHTWTWKTWNDLPYLTCSLLEPWAHGFLTHHFWPRPPAELTAVLSQQAETFRVKQVHGDRVLFPREVRQVEWSPDSEFPDADGLASEAADQAMWVCSADCTPALIGDIRTGMVAAVHAGWRGTSLKIVPRAIARLQAQGSQLQDLRVALGPAIDGSVYQVSEATAIQTAQTIAPLDPEDRPSSLAQLRALSASPILEDPELGRVKLDVRRVNALQLEQLGLAPEQVAIAPHCTFQEPESFFSYRRLKEKKAQWSGIVSR